MRYFGIYDGRGATLIDDTYQNIKFSRKLSFSDLLDNGTIKGFVDPYNSFATGTVRTRILTRESDELSFAAIGPIEDVVGKIMAVYRTDLGASYLAHQDGLDISGLKVFLFTKNQSPPDTNYGIEVYDSSSNLIFSSAYKYFKPLSVNWDGGATRIVGDGSKSVMRAIIFPLEMSAKTSAIQFCYYTDSSVSNPNGYFAGIGGLVVPNFRNLPAPAITCDCSYF